MNVCLLKDVANMGTAGQVLRVSEGYARNYLFPKKYAVAATKEHIERFAELKKNMGDALVEHGARIATLANHITQIHITLKRKINDKGKLYGALNAEDVAELLKEKNVTVNKRQVEFDKAIRTIGDYDVAIRLSSKLRPTLKITIVEEK